MNNLRSKAALVLLALASVIAVPVYAQGGAWYVSPAAVYYDDDPDRRIDDGVSGFQFTLGREFGYNFALEGIVSFADLDGFYSVSPGTVVRSSESQMTFGARALAFYDRDARLTPYVALGVGQLSQDFDVGGTENNPLVSLGGGLKWNLGKSRFALNAELRFRYVYDTGDTSFNDYIGTLGLRYNFGAPAGPRVVPSAPDVARDSDNDGVPDSADECPNTPADMAVDARGCPLDSDRDGVPIPDDRCPDSRPGADVDEFGCEADDDGDGVLNQYDACPDTRPGVRVDVRGCEIRDVISLPGVNFDTGSDRLLSGFEDLIIYAAETLKKHPELKIEVAGHTDDVGDARMNQGLSDRRAKTVMDHLVRYGVDPARLSFRGYGESQPIANNTSAEGRAQNRRVELRVVR